MDNNNSDSSVETKKIKRTRNRPCKSERFLQERKEIINKLNSIIGINEKDNNVCLFDLENNYILKEYLLNNIEKIREYYKTGTWGYFSKDLSKGMGNEISLLRAIYNNSNYKITSSRKIATKNGVKKLYTQLYFNKIL